MSASELSELQQAYVPLGVFADNAWQGLGGGLLLIDLPVAWLVTTASVLERAAGRPLAARVAAAGGQVTIVDVAQAQREAGIEWLRHGALDLAASLFPLQASWQLKGFSEVQIARNDVLQPPVQTCSLGCPPGQATPIALAGILSDVQAGTGMLLTSAPLLGTSHGAPLLVTGGLSGQVLLAGILTRTVLIPELDPRLPPLRMAEAIPGTAALALVRSDAARAMRDHALGKESRP